MYGIGHIKKKKNLNYEILIKLFQFIKYILIVLL